jgi:hypothetical protein
VGWGEGEISHFAFAADEAGKENTPPFVRKNM